MPVNPDFVGRTYPPSGPYAVDAALIAAFAAAVGASDPVHTDPEAARAAGYADVIAPPTLAVRFAQQADRAYVADPEAGIDFSRVVHGEQRFVHHRPITAGEPTYAHIQLDNLGGAPCPLLWRSRTPWAQVAASPPVLGPGETGHISVRLHPPRSLRGPQPVALELEAGALPLAVVLPVQVSPDGFWQRLRRLFG